MSELDILPVTYGYNNKYDATINPTLTNVFAAAAFRFGHTLVQGLLEYDNLFSVVLSTI